MMPSFDETESNFDSISDAVESDKNCHFGAKINLDK
jgi:hypothetical protein